MYIFWCIVNFQIKSLILSQVDKIEVKNLRELVMALTVLSLITEAPSDVTQDLKVCYSLSSFFSLDRT